MCIGFSTFNMFEIFYMLGDLDCNSNELLKVRQTDPDRFRSNLSMRELGQSN